MYKIEPISIGRNGIHWTIPLGPGQANAQADELWYLRSLVGCAKLTPHSGLGVKGVSSEKTASNKKTSRNEKTPSLYTKSVTIELGIHLKMRIYKVGKCRRRNISQAYESCTTIQNRTWFLRRCLYNGSSTDKHCDGDLLDPVARLVHKMEMENPAMIHSYGVDRDVQLSSNADHVKVSRTCIESSSSGFGYICTGEESEPDDSSYQGCCCEIGNFGSNEVVTSPTSSLQSTDATCEARSLNCFVDRSAASDQHSAPLIAQLVENCEEIISSRTKLSASQEEEQSKIVGCRDKVTSDDDNHAFLCTSHVVDGTDSSGHHGSHHQRSVSFTSIEVRNYPIVLGDHPSCSCGPPVSLGWEYSSVRKVHIDEYEGNRGPRRTVRQMTLDYDTRKDMLINLAGYSEAEIRKAERRMTRVRTQKSLTDLFRVGNGE